MKKEELIDVIDFTLRQTRFNDMLTSEEIYDKYKSINSTRRSERRADGSNGKAKEVCNCVDAHWTIKEEVVITRYCLSCGKEKQTD